MNDTDNKHCAETKFSCKRHYNRYRDNSHETACGEQDNPTRITLSPKNNSWPTLDFEMPRQRHELDRVELLMEKAYERGQADKMVEIRNLFRVIIGL